MEGWLYCRKWCNCNLLTSWININHLASGIHSLPSLSWYSMKGNCYYPVFWITGWPISSVPSFVFSHNALISLLRRSYSLILIYYSIRTRLLYSFLGPTVIHSKQIREKRKLRSKILLNRLANQGLERIVFSDEKLFTIEEATNTQNDRILAKTSYSIH